MGLNIKNTAVETEIRALAAETGESLTDAVAVAVRERLARVREEKEKTRPAKTAEEFLERMRPIQERIAEERRKNGDTRTLRELMDEFYDDDGLPI
jgi:antitoxin VapB